MEIDKLSHAERLELLRALAKITPTCAIDGCDNEPRHHCASHPVGEYDYGADVCDEHWAGGDGVRCWDCMPQHGPRTKSMTMLGDLHRQSMLLQHMDTIYDRIYDRIVPKIGQTITVRTPERYRAETASTVED